MTVLVISPQAKQDLEEMNERIAADNPQAANDFLDEILNKCETLANFPSMGRSRLELSEGLRSFPVNDYLTFYFPMENGIEIARIISGYRDLDALFDEEG